MGQLFRYSVTLLVLLPLMIGAQLSAADQGADEASPPPDLSQEVHKESDGEALWHFTSYLKGTTTQVRQQINGEVERLMAKTKASEKAIADAKASIKAEEKAALDRVHKDPQYVALKADLDRADAALALARKEGSSSDRLDASARCNHLRESMQQMENDALANDRALKEDRESLKDETAAVARHREAFTKAMKWRQTLIDAIRTSARLKWPLPEGATGTLGQVMVLRIMDANSALVRFDALEIIGKSGESEEIQNVDMVPHHVRLLVTGIDTKSLKEKEPTDIDKTFIVVRNDSEDAQFKVQRTAPTNIDRLFETILPLRQVAAE